MQRRYQVWLAALCAGLPAVTGGCAAATAPSYRLWEMTFATPRGEVLVTRISTAELFDGAGQPQVLQRMRPLTSCAAAWSDPHSRRIATVEREGDHDVVRVYGSAAALVDERPSDAWVSGRVRSCPSLSPGGRWIAYVEEHGALFTAEIDTGSAGSRVQVCELAPVRGLDMPARTCFWNRRGEVYVGCAGGVYRVRPEEGTVQFLDFGQLVGLAGDRPVVLSNDEVGATLRTIPEGRSIGTLAGAPSATEFAGLSPDAGYVAYFAPTKEGSRVLHVLELHSSRTAVMGRAAPGWRLGSWHEIDRIDADAPRISVACAADRRRSGG